MLIDDGRVVGNFIVQALRGESFDALWRWFADPVVLLRQRPDRGADPADEWEPTPGR